MRYTIGTAILLMFLLSTAVAQNFRTADSLLFDAQYDKVIEWADVQLGRKTTPETQILLACKKAEALIRSGKFSESEQLLKDLLPLATTPYTQAIVHLNYGALYLNEGRNDESLEALQQAVRDLDTDTKGNSMDAAQALAYLGNLYRTTGKYAQAEEQLLRSLAIRQKYLRENNEWIAASYNDLGLVYSQIDNDKALEYYEKALKIYQTLHGKDHPKIAIATTNIGFIYSRLELYGDATNNFESALKTWEKIYPQPHATKAFLLFNLGRTYHKLKNNTAALGYYDRALAMYEKSYGKKHPDIATVLNALGNIRIEEGKFDVALQCYQRALAANVANFENEDIRQNPRLESFYNGHTLINSLLYKAQALESRYYGKTIRIQDLALAIRTLQSCDTLIDRMRQHIINESDKISLGGLASDVYATGVRIAHEAGEVALKKKKYYSLAFFFAEKSKSAVLLEAISDINAKSFARIPDNLLQEEKSLKASIALTAQQLAQKPTAQEEKSLRETAFNLNRAYEGFTKQLEKNFPQYFNLKFNSASPSIEELQHLMDDRTALVSYFIDDKNEHLYTFLITRKKFRIIEHPLVKDFDKTITGLRNSLYFNATDTYKRTAATLSSDLLPKNIPGSISELVIIPTGRLSIIPFETLFTEKVTPAQNLVTLPYLLKRYSIRYEFSASLILQKSAVKPSAEISVFLCAPVTFKPQEHLNELPGTESEVTEIARLFSTRNFRNAAFTHQRADETLTKSGTLKEFSYLHFATHGIVDEKNPELSRIFLQSDAPSEDGSLFTGEIYNLELNANLVTLSACQTGLGKISKGEGVIGLSRALVYAGARNIMVSFWSVADESTALLMKDFYRIMLEDKNHAYGESLRKAKLELLKTEKYQSPYYWAPFVLIGF